MLSGQRLASNAALREHYGVTAVTMCRATRQLVRDGYLRSVRRSGVFVAGSLPHQNRFGVVFHSHPASPADWTRLDDVIFSETGKGIPGLDCTFVHYFDIRGDFHGPDYVRLEADVATQRIGGLFFTSDPWQVYGASFLHDSLIPKAAPGKRSDMDTIEFVPAVDRAIEWLAVERRRRRVAHIWSSTVLGTAPEHRAGLMRLSQRCDLEVQPHWFQYADIYHPESARQIVQLLLAAPPDARPDALLVADDNLIGEVEKGILAAGVRVPEDLEVVAHCNFPQPAFTRLPVRRLGYDIRDMLCNVVQRFRAAGPDRAPAVIRLLPVWQEEFDTRWANGGASGAAAM